MHDNIQITLTTDRYLWSFFNLRLLVAGALGLKATLSTLSSGGLRFEVEGES